MQEWIIAMLVISVLLVLRDMAKVFSGEEVSLRQSSRPKRKIPRRRRWSGMLLLFGSLQTAFMDYPTEKTI